MNGVGDPRQGTGNWTEVEVECFALLAVSFYSLKNNSYRLLPVGIKIVINVSVPGSKNNLCK